MIKKLLRSIRQKPKAVREQYAFWIACVLTSVVAGSWLMVTIGGIEVDESPGDSEVAVPAPDSLSNFLETTQEQFTSVQEEIQNLSPTDQSRSTATSTGSGMSVDGSAPGTSTIATSPVTSRQEVRIATTTSTSSASLEQSN